MVPVRLQLCNFLSYGEAVPPLELEHISTACLSGANGHGKSALLDALTYALWGETQRARRPAELVRLQSTEMWVELVFDHEGERFRVRRSYRLTARGIPSLELMIWDPAAEQWRALTCGSIKQTQDRINALLRLDYPTFVNSAFLLQGRADEFIRQQPRDRKRILGEILGLSRYERLHQLARDRVRGFERAVTGLEATLAQLAADLAGFDDPAGTLAETEQALAAAEAQLATLTEEEQTLNRQLREEEQRQADLARLADEVTRAQRDESDATDDLAQARAAVAAAEETISRRESAAAQVARLAEVDAALAEVEQTRGTQRALQAEQRRLDTAIEGHERARAAERKALERQRDDARRRLDGLRDTLSRRTAISQAKQAYDDACGRLVPLDELSTQHETIEARLRAAEQRVEQARVTLTAERDSLLKRLAEEQQRAAAGASADELTRLRAALEQAAEAVAAADEAQRQDAKLSETFERLKAERDQLRQRRDEAVEHAELLAKGEGQCPVCGAELDQLQRSELTADYDERLAAFDCRLDEINNEAREIKQQRAALDAARDGRERAVREQTRLQTELARAEAQQAQAREAAVRVTSLTVERAELERRLEQRAYAAEDRQAVSHAKQALAQLGYDPEQHRQLRRAVDATRGAEADYQRLVSAEQEQQEHTAHLEAAETELKSLTEQPVAVDEQVALETVRQQLAGVAVDEEAVAGLGAERQSLADAPALLDRIEQTAGQLPALVANVARLAERQEARARRVRELTGRRGALVAQATDLAAVAARADEVRNLLVAARQQSAELRERRGELRTAVARQQTLQQRHSQATAELQRVNSERTVMAQVAAAYGRDGIPAMLIEHAVPEIERAANELLGRLTGHRMHLAIRLQRPKVGGGEADTLDLEIGDELGTRSYENYSGGEAFRVNFALRLALSRLLARRAGARLRTLVIDEGFGTQDEEGLEQLVQAIHTIREEFDLVLVVTHLNVLKDRFPTRIEVVKEPDTGSHFEVVGEGVGDGPW